MADTAIHSRRSVGIVARFLRHKTGVLGAAILAVVILALLLGPLLVPYEPFDIDPGNARMGPSADHPLGTDEIGRDLLSRLLEGGRVTLFVTTVSCVAALLIGSTIGLMAGYFGGWRDSSLMRFVDVLLSLPTLLLAIAVSAALGPGTRNLVLALIVSNIPSFARLVRGAVVSLREREFVVASRALGATSTRTMILEIIPNALSPMMVYFTLRLATVILVASSLGFIGLGPEPPTPEWGSMLAASRDYINVAPHLVWFPGLAILALTTSFNFIGDGLRDVLGTTRA